MNVTDGEHLRRSVSDRSAHVEVGIDDATRHGSGCTGGRTSTKPVRPPMHSLTSESQQPMYHGVRQQPSPPGQHHTRFVLRL